MTPERAAHEDMVAREIETELYERCQERAWRLSLEEFEKFLPPHQLHKLEKLLETVIDEMVEDEYNNQKGY